MDFNGHNYTLNVKEVSDKVNLSKYFPGTKIITGQRITNIGLYSITLPQQANEISKILYNYASTYLGSGGLKSDFEITDATACIGGNTISFSNHFKHVNAVEIYPLHKEMLDDNIKSYNITNVTTYLADYTKIMLQLKQNIIFISPPWGGPEYHKKRDLSLRLGNIPIHIIINKLIDLNSAGIISCMVPINFNFNEIVCSLRKHNKIIHIHTIANFCLMVIVLENN